jgi:hypothetical protein
MHPINTRVTCVSPPLGPHRLCYQSRLIGEAVTVVNGAFYVSHLFTSSGRVGASLGGVANWLEKIEHAVAPNAQKAPLVCSKATS